MRTTFGTIALGLAALTWTSCEALTGVAPEGTPRVEVELTVLIHDAYLGRLVEVDPQSELVHALREVVRS